MPYIYTLPPSLTFRSKGLRGYSFGPMQQRELEILYVESETGHDTFMVTRGIGRTYYILDGSGTFSIAGREYPVQPGLLIEVPSGTEYSYSGRMMLLVICKRGWFAGKDRWTKWNKDVVGMVDPWPLGGGWGTRRVARLSIFGKRPASAFLRVNQYLWTRLPASFVALGLMRRYGHLLHALARKLGNRNQAFNTFFLRNRAELELMQRLVARRNLSETVRVAVLGCSTGAEAYSIAWAIRKARPDLKLIMTAVDISDEAVECARRGAYSLKADPGAPEIRNYGAVGSWKVSRPGSELVGSEVFERMTASESRDLFEIDDDTARVKDSFREGIEWRVADVREPEILETVGRQDIVVASNFLCHMETAEAERCLRNIARMVRPGGHLFVSGVDLDVRERVARTLGWEPVEELLEEIHDGDPCLRRQWPCQYGGLEPLNRRIPEWKVRYAAVFVVGVGREPPVQCRRQEPSRRVTQPRQLMRRSKSGGSCENTINRT